MWASRGLLGRPQLIQASGVPRLSRVIGLVMAGWRAICAFLANVRWLTTSRMSALGQQRTSRKQHSADVRATTPDSAESPR
jgi:hypothetical protein